MLGRIFSNQDHAVSSSVGGEVGKGLENREGQNNCFLNVGIQSLWHLLPFTSRFAACERHQHREHCVFCALKVILTNFEFSEEAVLPPQVLRITLDSLYKAEGKFKLGEIEDAAETLEAILENLHECIAADQQGSGQKEQGCQPPCVAHQVFGIEVLEQICCTRCQEESEPLVSSSWLYYVYSSSVRKVHERRSRMPFDETLQTIADQDLRPCPNERCKESSQVKRYLLREPDIFTLDLVWDSDAPSPAVIVDVLSTISTTITLDRIFNGGASSRRYHLKGMICYYGKHYDAYFYNPQRRRWVVFDDATVKEVGPTFENVINKCRLGHFQPSILFYEGEAVAEDARTTTATSTHESPKVIQQPEPEPEPMDYAITERPLVDLNFDQHQKEEEKEEKIVEKEEKRAVVKPDPEYKQTKRWLKDCLLDVIALVEMVSSPPQQVDIEILLVTATSLLRNMSELVDALERRLASHAQRKNDWTYALLDSAETAARQRANELSDLVIDLKLQRSKLMDRLKFYESAVNSAQKHRGITLASQMIESDLVLTVLGALKNALEATTLLYHTERQSAKGRNPPSPQPTATDLHVGYASPSLVAAPLYFAQPAAQAPHTPPAFFIPASPTPIVPSSSYVHYGGDGLQLAPAVLPSQIAGRGRTTRPMLTVRGNTPPARTPGATRYKWNSFAQAWSPLEDLSDFLKFDG